MTPLHLGRVRDDSLTPKKQDATRARVIVSGATTYETREPFAATLYVCPNWTTSSSYGSRSRATPQRAASWDDG